MLNWVDPENKNRILCVINMCKFTHFECTKMRFLVETRFPGRTFASLHKYTNRPFFCRRFVDQTISLPHFSQWFEEWVETIVEGSLKLLFDLWRLFLNPAQISLANICHTGAHRERIMESTANIPVVVCASNEGSAHHYDVNSIPPSASSSQVTNEVCEAGIRAHGYRGSLTASSVRSQEVTVSQNPARSHGDGGSLPPQPFIARCCRLTASGSAPRGSGFT